MTEMERLHLLFSSISLSFSFPVSIPRIHVLLFSSDLPIQLSSLYRSSLFLPFSFLPSSSFSLFLSMPFHSLCHLKLKKPSTSVPSTFLSLPFLFTSSFSFPPPHPLLFPSSYPCLLIFCPLKLEKPSPSVPSTFLLISSYSFPHPPLFPSSNPCLLIFSVT